jgi:excisionase family DNA binding protein
MLENANETIDLATEDVKERKQVQSQRDFEPLLDTEEAARLLRMHPRTLRTKARRGSIPAVQVGKRWRFRASTLGSLARQTRQLIVGTVRNKKYLDRNESPIYSDGVRRHRLSKGETLFRRTRYQHGSVEREERKKGPQSGSTDGGKKTSTGNWCTAKPRLGM